MRCKTTNCVDESSYTFIPDIRKKKNYSSFITETLTQGFFRYKSILSKHEIVTAKGRMRIMFVYIYVKLGCSKFTQTNYCKITQDKIVAR